MAIGKHIGNARVKRQPDFASHFELHPRDKVCCDVSKAHLTGLRNRTDITHSEESSCLSSKAIRRLNKCAPDARLGD